MAQAQAITPARDRRIPIRVQMKLEGEDTKGRHFSQTATTLDISRTGARLTSVQAPPPVNSLIDVQYGTGRARCQVVWHGRTPEERGQIGIRCLDENHAPWLELLSGVPASDPPASAATAAITSPGSGTPGWPEQDRRRSPRYSCNILATLRREGDSFSTSARLTDLSLTGGYLEAMSPLPVGMEILLTLETGSSKIPVTAVVRTMHPAMGNGVAFTKIDVEALELLQKYLVSLGASASGAAAGTPASATPMAGRAEAEIGTTLDRQIEALVALLEEKGILKREDLLRVLKNSESHVSM